MKWLSVLFALPALLGAEAAAQTRLFASAARSELSGGAEDWTEASLALAQMSGADVYVVRLEDSRRFGAHDLYGEVRFERATGGGSYYVALGGAGDADFRPELSLKAGGSLPLDAISANALFDIDQSSFRSGDVLAVRAGIERPFGESSVVRAFVVAVADENVDTGAIVQVEAQASRRLRLRFTLADAPETSEGQVTRVRSRGAGLQWELSDEVVLRGDVTSEDRGGYQRNELSVGAAWRL